MPYLPASCHPRRRDRRRRHHRHVLLHGQELELGFVELEPLALVREPLLAAEQAQDHADGLVLTVALHHRVDAERAGVRRKGARAGPEHRPPVRHVVELDHALSDVERVVVREADDARAESDAVGLLRRRGEEHLGRGDHLPARRVMLAAPELVETEPVEVGRELDVTLEQQRRVLAGRVVGGEEGTELDPWHREILRIGPTLGRIGDGNRASCGMIPAISCERPTRGVPVRGRSSVG